MSDPFDEATQGNTQQAAERGAEGRLVDEPESSDEGSVDSRLFGGESMPGIFTKKHDVGDSVTGIIRDVPFEKHARFYVEGEVGALKYWGDDGKPVKQSRGDDGKPSKPVMDLVIPLDTDYRFTPDQLKLKGLDEDTGVRGWYLSGGDAEKKFKAAMRAAGVKSSRALVGMRLTAKRTGKVKRGDFMSWTHDVVLTKP